MRKRQDTYCMTVDCWIPIEMAERMKAVARVKRVAYGNLSREYMKKGWGL